MLITQYVGYSTPCAVRQMVDAVRELAEEGWKKSYYLPENKEYVQVWQMTQHYSWHGAHQVRTHLPPDHLPP